MSKGSIEDFEVKIKSSTKLIDFLLNLKDIHEIPQNILNYLVEEFDYKNDKVLPLNGSIKTEYINKEETRILQELVTEASNLVLTEDLTETVLSNNEVKYKSQEIKISDGKVGAEQLNDQKNSDAKKELYLSLNDLKWINKIFKEQRTKSQSICYLHELLKDSTLIVPQNNTIPRNPELEARCKKLKEEQENQLYRNMTKNVDSVRKNIPEDTIAYQMKSINRQIIAVLQFVFSVAAGFAFGFIGVDLIVGSLEFGFRLLLGIMCALTIALAEIYFLAKKLNELDDTSTEVHLSRKKAHMD